MNKLLFLGVLALVSAVAWGQEETLANTFHPLQLSAGGKSLSSAPLKDPRLNSTQRLPLDVIPSKYKIELLPILEEPEEGSSDVLFTTQGKVSITFRVSGESQNSVLLHSRRLTIFPESVKLTRISSGAAVRIEDQVYQPENDMYLIRLLDTLARDEDYLVEINYLVNMDGADGLNGIYRAYYTDPVTNETRNLAATHMEPTRARKAFPGFDEPGFKAVFEISLGRKESYNTLSNMEINRTAPIDGRPGWVWDHYNPTPKMATYLVAAVISDFTAKAAPAGDFEKPVNIWGAEHLIAEGAGDYAATTAAKTIKYLQDTLKVNYDLPKIDSAAIPQFSPGAMENWGLNLYRENLLLTFQGITSEAERHDVANVIAHELAHQWTGNIVTCKWWSDIWLNEGFATYWSYEAEQAKEFEPDSRFFTEVTQTALNADILPSTHPIHNPSLETVNVSPLFFDRIAYEKAGSVIKMFEKIVGKETFIKGLTRYLTEMNLKAAEQDDLFYWLEQEIGTSMPAGLTVKEFFDSWTLKSGFPLVRVTKFGEKYLGISQEKYQANAKEVTRSEISAELWHIPISITQKTNMTPPAEPQQIWLRPDQLSTIHSGLDLSQLLLVNFDSSGFYRTLYDEPLLALIEAELNAEPNTFNPVHRAQLIDDHFNFAAAAYQPPTAGVKLTKFLGQETDLVVWQTALGHLQRLKAGYFELPGGQTLFQSYLLPIVNAALTKLEESATDKGAPAILRALLLDWACAFKDANCLRNARTLFDEWETADTLIPANIPGDIQAVVYCAALSASDSDSYSFAMAKYQEQTNPIHRARLLRALTCDESNIDSLLRDTLANEEDREILEADRLSLVQALATNQLATRSVLSFIEENLGETPFLTPDTFAAVLTTISTLLHREADALRVEAFLEANEEVLAPVAEVIKAAAAQIRANEQWNRDLGTPIQRWFIENTA